MSDVIKTNFDVVSECVTDLYTLYNEINELSINGNSIKSSGEAAEQLKAIISALQTSKNDMAELIRVSHDFAQKSLENHLNADKSSSVK